MGESGSEYESDSEDEMFIGMSAEEIKTIKARMASMQSGFETNAENNKKEAIAKIKQEIEFNLAVTVDDELASFIADFITENNENVNNEPVILSQQLQSDGVYFLQSMKEMMEQTNSSSNTKSYANDHQDSTLYDND